MDTLRSPRGRLLTALGLLLLLGLGSAAGGMSTAALARWGLGGCALGLGAWVWARRAGAARGRFVLPERLHVHARAGLSPRCGLALVEADGERFLVAYGEGFATIRRASPSVGARGRRDTAGGGRVPMRARTRAGGAP